MERGTEGEIEALRERWTEMERERVLADRLVYGAGLIGVGGLLLLLPVPSRACDHGGGVAGTVCTAVAGPPVVEAALVTTGAVAVVAGAWRCWRVVGATRKRVVETSLR